MVATLLGGIGFFLLGMTLLTDGLKGLAGRALRDVLTRSVRGPVSGMLAGAGVTALAQSSSATTLMTIGFVSAGLMTFQQSLGVIFGANLGTTSTGWIVSLLGFKVSVSAAAMPMVFAGAALRLFSRERAASAGMALAGFGLIFVGIDLLQEGMAGLSARVDPASLPGGGDLLGRLMLVGIGVVMTFVMQSSSAAMATTLAALDGGAIGFEQAAALAIGQNIGTTITAALAALGASAGARRTAAAHILFNTLTGGIAFGLFPWFVGGVVWLADRAGGEPGVVSLAIFHSAFNLLGVLVFLPLIAPFGWLVTRIVPGRRAALTGALDASAARVPAVGLEAARRAMAATLGALLEIALLRLRGERPGREARDRLEEAHRANEETREFLGRVARQPQDEAEVRSAASMFHAVDHLHQLAHALGEPTPAPELLSLSALGQARELGEEAAGLVASWCADPTRPAPAQQAAEISGRLAEVRRSGRAAVLERLADAREDARRAAELADALRWIDRVGYHAARATRHLAPAPTGAAEAAVSAGDRGGG